MNKMESKSPTMTTITKRLSPRSSSISGTRSATPTNDGSIVSSTNNTTTVAGSGGDEYYNIHHNQKQYQQQQQQQQQQPHQQQPRLLSSPSNDYDSDDNDSDVIDEEDELLDSSNTNTNSSANAVNTATRQFDLCGSMFKRRGGFGRNAENKWVMRCFTLYGSILCYHEESDIEQVTDPSDPRARLNLQKTETIAEMHSKHKPGLPTEHLLTINIYTLRGKRKWEMCCTSKEQQVVWYNAILAFDGKTAATAEGTALSLSPGAAETTMGGVSVNRRRTWSAGNTDQAMERLPSNTMLNLPSYPDEDGRKGTASTPRSHMAIAEDVDLIAKAAAKAVEILNEEQQQQQRNALSPSTVILLIVVLNVASYCIRNGSDQTYKATLFFMNAFVLYAAFHGTGKKASAPPRKSPAARVAKAKKRKFEAKTSTTSAPGMMEKSKSFSKSLPVGSTIPRTPAKNNSELDKQLQKYESNTAETIKSYAAASPVDLEIQPHSYGNIDNKLFQLREGPNYKKNKQKSPSGPALYDLYSMDFLYADTALKNASDKFRIPSIPGVTDISTGHAHIPPMFIINTWLPGEEPSMFSKNTDGETYSTVMVFVLSKDTLEQLKDIDRASPGVKLFSEWCRRAETDAEFRGRFKCMGIVEDIESTGVPKFIHGYNGKPALVTKSGIFKRHDNYIEFSINVHMWAFLAKKGLHTLAPKFPEFIFNIGFTIEARKDDEMPEVLLGGCRIMNLDPDQAVVDGVDDVQL